MDPAERIFERGKSYHMVSVGGFPAGKVPKFSEEYVWDHSLRVLELSRRICFEHQIDLEPVAKALTAAALFHDAGWTAMLRAGEIPATSVLFRPGDLALRRKSEQVLRSEVADLLDEHDLDLAGRYILALAARRHDAPVSQALSDAENLEEIGLVGVLRQVRSGLACGKSASRIVEAWRRQREYHYWEARTQTGLSFELSRRLARDRLERMGSFFELLEKELELDDLNDLCRGERTRSGSRQKA